MSTAFNTTGTGIIGTSTSTWKLDPAHTFVEFSGKHMMVSTVKGRFSGVDATITLDENDILNSSVTATIDAATLESGVEFRDNHLRSADFLDVEKYPNITFQSRRIESRGGNDYVIVGDLTIRDVTKEVALETEISKPAISPYGQTVIGFEAKTKINRKDWGLNWNVALEAGGMLVSGVIKIEITGEAIKQ